LAGNGKDVEMWDTVTVKRRREKCIELGDSIVRKVGAIKSNSKVESFPGIGIDLSWTDQVNYTVQRACRALYFVMRVVKMGNKNTKV
jgi:pimeloyl-CoA synthetase